MAALDLTKVLPHQILSDILASINIYTEVKGIFDANTILEETLLDNVNIGKYKQPTKTIIKQGGSVWEQWLLDGFHHREDGPAYVISRDDGSREEKWYLNGRIHREEGPAMSEWRADGPIGDFVAAGTLTKISEEWRQNNFWHRIDGPAIIKWSKDGVIEETKWYVDGEKQDMKYTFPNGDIIDNEKLTMKRGRSYTRTELADFARRLNLGTSGNKSKLLELIRQYMFDY